MTMEMKLKMKNRSHRYDINRPLLNMDTSILTIYNVSHYNDGYRYQATEMSLIIIIIGIKRHVSNI